MCCKLAVSNPVISTDQIEDRRLSVDPVNLHVLCDLLYRSSPLNPRSHSGSLVLE